MTRPRDHFFIFTVINNSVPLSGVIDVRLIVKAGFVFTSTDIREKGHMTSTLQPFKNVNTRRMQIKEI